MVGQESETTRLNNCDKQLNVLFACMLDQQNSWSCYRQINELKRCINRTSSTIYHDTPWDNNKPNANRNAFYCCGDKVPFFLQFRKREKMYGIHKPTCCRIPIYDALACIQNNQTIENCQTEINNLKNCIEINREKFDPNEYY